MENELPVHVTRLAAGRRLRTTWGGARGCVDGRLRESSTVPPRATTSEEGGRMPASAAGSSTGPGRQGSKRGPWRGSQSGAFDASLVANRRPGPRARCARTPARPLPRLGQALSAAPAPDRAAYRRAAPEVEVLQAAATASWPAGRPRYRVKRGRGVVRVGPACQPPVMRAAVLRVVVRQIWFASTASVTACDILSRGTGGRARCRRACSSAG